jgi:hypothetical protein
MGRVGRAQRILCGDQALLHDDRVSGFVSPDMLVEIETKGSVNGEIVIWEIAK